MERQFCTYMSFYVGTFGVGEVITNYHFRNKIGHAADQFNIFFNLLWLMPGNLLHKI